METKRFKMDRRRLVIRSLGVAGACALGMAAVAPAAAKASKAALLYQDQPNGGKRCGDCKFFSAATDANSGSCALVEGAVERNGWCMAFSPKS